MTGSMMKLDKTRLYNLVVTRALADIVDGGATRASLASGVFMNELQIFGREKITSESQLRN